MFQQATSTSDYQVCALAPVKPPLVAFVGATATGKTALAIALAKMLGGEIINADSMQFYRGMDIGTAKASVDEREGIPHHLLDLYDLQVEASVATFQTLARTTISEVRSRNRVPILTGGSGLYVRAALDTLEFPPTDPDLRHRLAAQVENEGIAPLVDELQHVDPVSAQRLQDERRIIRAVEVHRLTGRTFSSYMPTRQYHPNIPPVVQIGLKIERATLHERIEQRVYTMLEAGWLDEVQHLRTVGLEQAPTASRAIGYRQMLDYLAGNLSKQQAIDETIVATRRFARRQETWFKADPRVHWIDPQDDHALAEILRLVKAS